MHKARRLLLLLCLLGCVFPVFGQTTKIHGIIYDEADMEVIGATVRLKSNPAKGTASDMDGKFVIEAKRGELLIISYVGYKTLEVPAKDGMVVKLEPDAELLEDVVIVGYMPRKITNTSASVVKVDAKELTAKPNANPLDAVQGKVTGLQVFSSSGEPSSQLSIALHGQGSLGAGTSPLFILDGMPVSESVIRAMNPNDLESVEFLKDAAATSIYGARAANGVVYMTSKRGKADEKAQITLRAQYGVSSLANTDYFDQLMTADELLRYYLETAIYTEAEVKNFRENIFKGNDFQWYKYIYQNAPMYTADLSVSSGTGRTSYYISGGLLSQGGLREGSSYKKAFARVNLNAELNDWIRSGVNINASYDDARTSPFGGSNISGGGLAALNPPFISPYDPQTGKLIDLYPIIGVLSPKHVIETSPAGTNTFILSANGNVTITPVRNLFIRSMAGIEMDYGTNMRRTLPSLRTAYGIGSASRGYQGSINFSTTNTISFMTDFGGSDHHLTSLLGHEYIDYRDDGFSAGGVGLLDDRLNLLGNLTRDYVLAESNLRYSFLSFFGQFAYDYDERYFVDLVLRNDASSRFGANKRNGLFWSAGLLWKAKNEDFLKGVDWINALDVKASYGTQGNSAIPPYSTESYVGNVGRKKGEISLGFFSFGNPDLTWEKQSKLTVGFKGRFFDRIGLNLEYYHRMTTDMLFEVPISYASGLPSGSLDFVTHLENVGAYLNQGIDLRLDADLLKSRDYYLSGYLNFNYNRDKVVELFGGRKEWFEPGSQLAYVVGQPVTYMLPVYKGVNTDTGVPEWYLPGEDKGVLTKDDTRLTSEWNSTLEQNTGIPAYTPMVGGWGLEGRYKGLYVTADFAFAINKMTISMDRNYFENDALVRDRDQNLNGTRLLFDYWKKPGDVTTYPSLAWLRDKKTIHQSNYVDTKMLENATFMRLKNLTIGYDVPSETLRPLKIVRAAKIYFAGRNLLTFTKFKGIDPEVFQNVALGANPNTKQLSVGVELGF